MGNESVESLTVAISGTSFPFLNHSYELTALPPVEGGVEWGFSQGDVELLVGVYQDPPMTVIWGTPAPEGFFFYGVSETLFQTSFTNEMVYGGTATITGWSFGPPKAINPSPENASGNLSVFSNFTWELDE
jgi:hypothetical protein